MNDYRKLVPFIKKFEGGLSKSKNDAAAEMMCPTAVNGVLYHTNKGITYRTWVAHFGKYNNKRFINMNDEDWGTIFEKSFWNKINAENIPFESISFVLSTWCWGSGNVTGAIKFQEALNRLGAKIKADGSIGPKTCDAITALNITERELFERLCDDRESFFRYISNPVNEKTPEKRVAYENNKANLAGWIRRLDEFRSTFRP